MPTINAGQWCDRYRIELEKLYGTQLHWRGATLADLKIVPDAGHAAFEPGIARELVKACDRFSRT